jgi:hypothetical protein
MVSVMIVRSRIRPQDRMLFQEDLTRQLRVHVSVGRLHGLRSKFREGLRAEGREASRCFRRGFASSGSREWCVIRHSAVEASRGEQVGSVKSWTDGDVGVVA